MARKVTEAQYTKAMEVLARWNIQIALEDAKLEAADGDCDEVVTAFEEFSINYEGDMAEELSQAIHDARTTKMGDLR